MYYSGLVSRLWYLCVKVIYTIFNSIEIFTFFKISTGEYVKILKFYSTILRFLRKLYLRFRK